MSTKEQPNAKRIKYYNLPACISIMCFFLNILESKASGVSPGIYGAIAGALLLVIIVAAVVIYKYGFRKPKYL